MLLKNWKILAYKIKDLNVSAGRDPKTKYLLLLQKGMTPSLCPAMCLPIHSNNIVELTQTISM